MFLFIRSVMIIMSLIGNLLIIWFCSSFPWIPCFFFYLFFFWLRIQQVYLMNWIKLIILRSGKVIPKIQKSKYIIKKCFFFTYPWIIGCKSGSIYKPLFLGVWPWKMILLGRLFLFIGVISLWWITMTSRE